MTNMKTVKITGGTKKDTAVRKGKATKWTRIDLRVDVSKPLGRRSLNNVDAAVRDSRYALVPSPTRLTLEHRDFVFQSREALRPRHSEVEPKA